MKEKGLDRGSHHGKQLPGWTGSERSGMSEFHGVTRWVEEMEMEKPRSLEVLWLGRWEQQSQGFGREMGSRAGRQEKTLGWVSCSSVTISP